MRDVQLIALERVQKLMREASSSFKKYPERSHRYVALARKVAMKARVKLPFSLKRKFCKHCYHFLQPGANCRVRTREKKLVTYCFHCRKYSRISLRARTNAS